MPYFLLSRNGTQQHEQQEQNSVVVPGAANDGQYQTTPVASSSISTAFCLFISFESCAWLLQKMWRVAPGGFHCPAGYRIA
jgi:hypothetical protein